MRCLQCGCNHDANTITCWRCGALLPQNRRAVTRTVDMITTPNPNPAIMTSMSPGTLAPVYRTLPVVNRAEPRQSPVRSTGGTRRISGTVIAAEQIREEKRDVRWWSIVGRLFLALVALGSLPLLILLCMFKIISLPRMFSAIFLVNMTRRDHTESTQYFRIREGLNREYIVRRKGHLEGHIMPGDEVELQGKFKKGIFYMKRGTNTRVGASLR